MTKDFEILNRAYAFPVKAEGNKLLEADGALIATCRFRTDADIIAAALNGIYSLAEKADDASKL